MGLTDNPSGTLDATLDAFLSPILALYKKVPDYLGPDFPEGFWIEEFDPEKGNTTTRLTGQFMPHQPMTSVSKHKVTQEYYPGNTEPAMQMLGGRYDNQTIKGQWNAKKFDAVKHPEMRFVPQALRNHFDGIRERGNVLRLSLGSWERWGFLVSCTFNMRTLAVIDYELEFAITGAEKPVNCKLVGDSPKLPVEDNAALIEAASDWQEALLDKPKDFPGTLWDEINAGIGEVMTALAVVTKTADSALNQAAQGKAAFNKVLGSVKYLKAKLSSWKMQLGIMSAYDTPSKAPLTSTQIMVNQKYIQKATLSTTKSSTGAAGGTPKPSIEELLNSMQAKFKALSLFVPKAKHLVKTGDTLQTIAVKHYGAADNWSKIYEHNKLTTTELVAGTVLEIPNLA